ncbi:MAG: SUMF1/EgtB/PvdO family nonheme iron enzyme [Opitutales bacterium]|nr:SUMF1/EgtB/PvdO family nonheme iron enzyme [Opitutales bacterium]
MKKLILSVIAHATLLCVFFLRGTPPPPGPPPQDTPTLREGPYGVDVSIYEITQKQYQLVMGNNPSHFKGDNLPVENVSWNEAVEFCRKLTS